jgi:hypothetical protein
LSAEEVERIFALGFMLEQLRADIADLAHCTNELAQPNRVKPFRAAREIGKRLQRRSAQSQYPGST